MLVRTAELHRIIADASGTMGRRETGAPYISTRDVALVIGGGGDPLSELEAALAMCRLAGKPNVEILACNDLISRVPDPLHNAVTLHPDKMPGWLKMRHDAGREPPERLWAHRPYVGFTHYTRDWQGSSGLLMTKIAREIALTHVILCGVPMTVEHEHFVRRQRWNAAHGFRRGWIRHIPALQPFVRSMSGWTQEQFGEPTLEWIASAIEDTRPMRPESAAMRA